MLSRSLRKIAHFLIAVSREQPKEPSQRQIQRQREAQRREFDKRMRRVIERRASPSAKLVAGSVQLLGMDAIKAELGDSWLAVADQAHAIAESTIRAHLDEGDAFDRRNGDTYILCFSECDKQEATHRTAQIVGEIKRRLEERVPQAAAIQIEHDVAELEWQENDAEDAPLIDLLAEGLRKVRAEAEQSAKQWKRMLVREASVVYTPIWNAEERKVSMFRCILGDAVGRSVVERIQSLSGAQEMLQTLSELDLVIVSRAVQAIHDLVQKDHAADLVVPLTFHTLTDKRARDAFFVLCRDIPDAYKNFIIFELHSIPAQAPSSKVVEAIQHLKPLAKSVILQMPLDEHRLQQLSATGLYAAAFDASWFAQRTVNMELYLTRYVRYARAAKMRALIYGIGTNGLLQAGIKSQADYLAGEAVARPLDAPKNAYGLNMGDVWVGASPARRLAGAH